MAHGIKLLALLGSPRRNGNTEALLQPALAAAREAGAETEVLRMRDLKISSCIECNTCSKTGKCVLSDDMTGLYPKIEQADRLILASPMFFYSVSGWLKAAIDRFQPLWARKYLLNDPAGAGKERWGGFLSVGATKGKRLFDGAIMTARYCLADANIRYFGHLLVGGVEHTGDTGKHPEYLARAEEFGRLLVTNPAEGFKYTNIKA